MKRLLTYSISLDEYTGLHQVLSKVHNVLKSEFDAKVVGNIDYSQVHKKLGIEEDKYIKLRNPFVFYNSLVVVHERKILPFLWILKILFLGRIKIVYIHHSILKGYKYCSFFPKNIITISDKCIENLTEYFKVPITHITKLYNCVDDEYNQEAKSKKYNPNKIKILYPAKVYETKRQIEIVKYLKNELSDNIQIIFAGDGPDLEKLKRLVSGDKRFSCLGFVNDMISLYKDADYVMLFSKYEGLPISLIEGTMTATPLICNDVGGNLEIGINSFNAMVNNDWTSLLICLNNLSNINEEEYKRMSKNSRMMYEDNFTYNLFKENYLKYFRKLIYER